MAECEDFMFGIGAGEFILIMIVGLIVFGPSKLPEIGRSLGKMIREFKKAQLALSATLSEADEPSTVKTTQTQSQAATQVTQSEPVATTVTTTKTPSIEEVTKMINENPISMPQEKVNLSKETVNK